VKAIKLDGNPIKNVTKNAFMGLENMLEELHLSMDKATMLPTDSWASLKRLKIMDLSRFSLEKLVTSSFAKLSKLEDLRMTKSGHRRIDPQAFEELSRNLKRLDLKENLLNRVPSLALKKLTNLQNLSLDTNLIMELNNEAFSGLKRLKFVSLWFNQMQRITSRAFQGLEYSLLHLGLQYNKLQNDDMAAIGKLRHLEELKLGFNQISRFPHNMFKNMVYLKYLNLEYNHVESLSNETFRGLKGSLETLDISKNKLYGIQGSPFQGFFKLKHLFINQNNRPYGVELKFTTETIKGLEFNLEILSLESMSIVSSVLDAIGKLRMLKVLHLCKNHISIIPHGIFRGTSRLAKGF
jgi:leucine-rich repeat-containing G protein-coupled receptor 6